MNQHLTLFLVFEFSIGITFNQNAPLYLNHPLDLLKMINNQNFYKI